ncbi:MAG: hypothetical protein IT435_01630 [Phycisphaerales bacterium]|nr:hypothetical protein [Phycisphaerales bacterium]
MTEMQAIQKAMDSRAQFGVPTSFAPMEAQKRYIELVRDGQKVTTKAPAPGPVRDLIAWVITLTHDARTVEFAIEDSTAEVVRFTPSRSAALDLYPSGVPTFDREVTP